MFQWLFRVTHNWAAVVSFIPDMRRHLRAIGNLEESRPITPISTSSSGNFRGDAEYSVIFRELFCVAAAGLAEQLNESVEKLGVLYDGIMTTGKGVQERRKSRNHTVSRNSNVGDVEAGNGTGTVYGKGQFLFLVRQVDTSAADRLESAGFRFANVNYVGEKLARSMQVTLEEVTGMVENLRGYSRGDRACPIGGTFFACFAIRAPLRIMRNSAPKWEVLVTKDNPNSLPAMQLSPFPLKAPQMDILSRLDGLTIDQCIQNLADSVTFALDKDRDFIQRVKDNLLGLLAKVPEQFFRSAVFCATPIDAQMQNPDGLVGRITILPFCVIPDVHWIYLRTESLIYTPLSFFKARHQVYRGSPDHAVLSRRTHQEFGPVLATNRNQSTVTLPTRNGGPARLNPFGTQVRWSFSTPLGSRSSLAFKQDGVSDTELATRSSSAAGPAAPNQRFGGILVSSEFGTVDGGLTSVVDLELGTSAEARAAQEQPNFVDELFKTTCARWSRR